MLIAPPRGPLEHPVKQCPVTCLPVMSNGSFVTKPVLIIGTNFSHPPTHQISDFVTKHLSRSWVSRTDNQVTVDRNRSEKRCALDRLQFQTIFLELRQIRFGNLEHFYAFEILLFLISNFPDRLDSTH